MRTITLLLPLLLVWTTASAQSLTQTFEPGEDTTDWGNAGFSSPLTSPTFLDEPISSPFGGTTAGGGETIPQNYTRQFRNNTVGLDVEDDAYTIALYVQLDLFSGDGSSAQFQIFDGSFGNNNTANIRIEQAASTFQWQARNASNVWQDVGITMEFGEAYYVQMFIDPVGLTYDVLIANVNPNGSVVSSASLNDLTISGQVITNDANGTLSFFNFASGTDNVGTRVDNITIVQGVIPEPATGSLLLLTGLGLLRRRRRP
ncbi:MAG: PEP-CTERM sorting domain-containing protein [Verrucomicrobiota bacterium]